MWTCPKCEYNVQGHLAACWNCNTANPNPIEPAPPRILLTTTPSLDRYRVIEVIDIISAECVFGMNMFRNIAASLNDVFGGRNEATQRTLREARQTCLTELRKEADAIEANAVIGVTLNYSEFSGGGKSLLFLVATGTAVKVEATLEPKNIEVDLQR